jgi:CRP/FNR family transcriptional regulator, dissimilatory nitrate respiration regulator
MSPHPDALSFLSQIFALTGVEASTMKRIASRCRPRSRQPGESLFREGEPCRDLYILVAGRVKCFRANPEGREQILKIFEQPGDIFCTTSAFSTGSHIVTAEAMSEVSLYVIDVDTMKRVALERPVVALALVTAAGEQMRSLVSLADDLSLKTATTRVAKLLWERARAEGGRAGKEIRLRRAGLREDEVAALVGTVRVHVSRSLKTLATMGAIRVDRDTIYISDLKALEGFLHAVEPD